PPITRAFVRILCSLWHLPPRKARAATRTSSGQRFLTPVFEISQSRISRERRESWRLGGCDLRLNRSVIPPLFPVELFQNLDRSLDNPSGCRYGNMLTISKALTSRTLTGQATDF
ncbi:hypothetical protein GE09DRAFT_1118541, partial [Coniochaeta sp. 2T2.1]